MKNITRILLVVTMTGTVVGRAQTITPNSESSARTAIAATAGVAQELPAASASNNPASPSSPVKKLAWGEPVENLAVSLQADKTVWRSDETPILHASLRNDGEMILMTGRTDSYLQQVEVDGKWYRSRATYYEIQGTNGQEAIMSGGGALNEIQPGEQWDNVQISLRQGDWQRASTNDLALATYPFRNWVVTDTGIAPVMSLWSGKHTVRVAFVVDPARAIYARPAFRVISNPVELEIQNASPQVK